MNQSSMFTIPPVVITGPDASTSVGEEAKRISGTRALIVTDKGISELGYVERIAEKLKDEKISFAVFDDVQPDPTTKNVMDGLEIYKRENCDFLVAVGGGSPIDSAKGTAVMAANHGNLQDYQGVGKIPHPGAPLIAIPTTAGTGSEVTKVAVITDTERNVKMMMSSPCLLATAALVDPLLTLSVPPALTAAVGVDSLTHAVEAYISKRAQPITDALALSAVGLISGNLRSAWANGDDIEARTNMTIAATKAGMAFSNSSVALVHGMSRPIGAYFHIHHGLSNAVLLPAVMEFTFVGNLERFADIALAMGENLEGLSLRESARKAVEAIVDLNRDIEMPRLGDIGVTEDKLKHVVQKMAEDAIDSGSPANNPRVASKEQIIELYFKSL